MSATLEGNLLAVRERIARAATAAGRSPASVELVAVTKSVGPETAAELVHMGQRDLGESRADVLVDKARALANLGLAPRWHFLGHLQRNKARRVVEHAHVVHSIDSTDLFVTLDRLAGELGRALEGWLQVELGEGSARTGLTPSELGQVLAVAGAARSLRLCGLMTIAPLAPDPRESAATARTTFRALRELARATEAQHGLLFVDGRVRLSMGMSEDFELAIAEASDCVRVGSALFAGLANGSGGRHAA